MPRNTRSRAGNGYVSLYSVQTHGEGGQGQPVLIRKITGHAAIELIGSRKAYMMYEQDGTPALRMVESFAGERTTPGSLAEESMLCVSGAGLKKPHEVSGRHLRKREEAEAAKVLVWPLIGDDRAVSVRPKVSDAELERARAYLKSA